MLKCCHSAFFFLAVAHSTYASQKPILSEWLAASTAAFFKTAQMDEMFEMVMSICSSKPKFGRLYLF